MIRAVLLGAAVLGLPGTALAEDWREVKGVESVGAQFWVDMDSIQVENGITRFRTRVLVPNTPGYAYADSVADCAAKTAEMRHLEIVRDGKVVGSKDFEPGSGVQSLDDEQGKALSALICPS